MSVCPTFRSLPALLAFTLLLTLPLGSCEKVAATKTISVTLGADLTLNVASTDPLSGAWTTILDSDENIDVRTNRAKIKDISIERLAYVVDAYNGPAGVTGRGNWKFYATGLPGTVFPLVSAHAVDFGAFFSSGAEQELPVNAAAQAKLVELIKAGKTVTFAFEGAVTDKPVSARFHLQLATRVQVGL